LERLFEELLTRDQRRSHERCISFIFSTLLEEPITRDEKQWGKKCSHEHFLLVHFIPVGSFMKVQKEKRY